jgi:tripartite-type tricarboxylate transporter receptor subunit TctC
VVSRRQLLLTAPVMVAGLPALAAEDSRYPERVVRIVIGNAPGGTDDLISRVVAAKLSAEFGRGVIVDNRGGGSTTIAGAHVAGSPPDGYTLLCLISSSIAQTALRPNLPYGLGSFVPVVGVGGFPLALAGSATTPQKVTSFEELVAAAKGPNGITFASGGVGTMAHLNTVRLLKAVGGKGVHVPYRNNPESLQALTGGYTQVMMASVSEVAALRSDKLRALAVTSEQRLPSLPDVPTMRELGLPQINPTLWHGYVAPAGTPAEIVAKLSAAIGKAVKDPEFQNKFKSFSFQEDLRTGAALSGYITGEAARWKEVIVENNIKITD